MNLTTKLEHLKKKQEVEHLLCGASLEQAKCFFQLAREHESKLVQWWYFHRALFYQNRAITHSSRGSAYSKEYWQFRREIKKVLDTCARTEGYELKFERVSG